MKTHLNNFIKRYEGFFSFFSIILIPLSLLIFIIYFFIEAMLNINTIVPLLLGCFVVICTIFSFYIIYVIIR